MLICISVDLECCIVLLFMVFGFNMSRVILLVVWVFVDV